jgi:Family of unknown function (DUF5681)
MALSTPPVVARCPQLKPEVNMKKRAPKMVDTFEVGYRKPPTAGRYQKGQSGNIRGRPQGSKNIATLLKEAGDAEIIIEIDGVQRRMSRREAAVTNLYSRAAAGDRHATSQIFEYESKLKIGAEHDHGEALDAVDEEVVEAAVKRLQRKPEESGDE